MTVPTFNDPESVGALLESLESNARRFGWKLPPIVIFDASSDVSSAARIRALANSVDRTRSPAIYLAANVSPLATLPSIHDFNASHRGLCSLDEVAGMFNSTAGGNLNLCFTYFGPDVSVLNFDHDVLPVVEVPEEALRTLATSNVSLADDVVRFECPASDRATRRIPVDFMYALRTSAQSFVLAGREVVEGDDESYKLVQLGGAATEAQYAVGHICGVQDHSARYLLELVLAREASLSCASPPRFIPKNPVFPALVTASKLITTTLTFRRHDLADSSVGFVGTGVRVHDFLTGAFQRALCDRPIFWAPVYFLHNRKYGLREEREYGRYLLNEEYMHVFLDLCTRLGAMGFAGNFELLSNNWRHSLEQAPLAQFIDRFLERAEGLRNRLRSLKVDETYLAAAESIDAAFRLGESPAAARAHHLGQLLYEANRVSSHLDRRSQINMLGRLEGTRRWQSLTSRHCENGS
jgi:hypothetical protein